MPNSLLVLTAAALLAVSQRPAGAQTAPPSKPPAAEGDSGTFATSAAVMTTYATRRLPSGEALELVILWRGTPGWFTRGRASSSSGGVTKDGWRHRFSQGGLEFEAALDFKTRNASIQGEIIKLGGANVILVDSVDSLRGARVAGTLTVDARLGEGSGYLRILPVLARSKEIRGYLRCDTELADERLQQRLAPVCASILELAK
jgi:hypothetical protein